jgi:hypothetical protein
MQQKLHEQVVKLRKIYEGLRLAILEIIRAVCAETARTPATEIRISPQKSVIVTSYRSGALQATSGAPRGFPSIETIPTGIVAHDCPAQILLAMAVHWGPSPSLSRDRRGEKNRPPPIRRQRYPKPLGVRFCAFTRDPASVRSVLPSVKRSAQLSSEIRGRRFETRLGPGMIRAE